MPPYPCAPEQAARTLVVIPAQNEEATVAGVVRAARTALPHATVLVVDDGSEDGTVAAAWAAGAKVAPHTFNLGYGAALHTGYLYARRHGLGPVVQMDADGQHEAQDLPDLLAPLARGEADVVVGSRFLSGDRPRLSPHRRLGILFFSGLATLGLRRRLTDPTSGFQALSPRALDTLMDSVFPDDYPDADVLLHLHQRGCRIVEVPARMYVRSSGRSMHAGLKGLYYLYKMSLSLALTPLRTNSRRSG